MFTDGMATLPRASKGRGVGGGGEGVTISDEDECVDGRYGGQWSAHAFVQGKDLTKNTFRIPVTWL